MNYFNKYVPKLDLHGYDRADWLCHPNFLGQPHETERPHSVLFLYLS